MTTLTVEGRLAGHGPARITVIDGRIDAITTIDDAPPYWIFPGLLDLQVNGYNGFDINTAGVTPDVIRDLARAEWRHGVTAFCPTIVTASEERIIAALRAVADARAADPLVRHAIPCVHVEGPHLSSLDGARGAHDAAWIRPPDIAEFHRWQDASGGLVGVVTVAPELPGACDYIAAVTKAGSIASIGHCAARAEDVAEAVRAGARMSTHLGNATTALLPRHPNHIWAQLANDALTACFISDGDHLPAETFVSMVRAKGLSRTVLVSDSAALAGAPSGDYTTPVGGSVTVTATGRLNLTGTELLAGSGRNLAECVAWAVLCGRLKLPDAVMLASTNPARMLGLSDRGEVRVGEWADLVVADHDENAGAFKAIATLVAGEVVHAAQAQLCVKDAAGQPVAPGETSSSAFSRMTSPGNDGDPAGRRSARRHRGW